jgi:hypothetical protein
MHVNSHALPSVNSILLQHPVLYLDGNHGLAGLCICLLIEVQPSSNVRQDKLVWDFTVTYVILLSRAGDRILSQDPVP